MQPQRVGVILAVFAMSCWFSSGQTQSEPRSGIKGVITIGPIRPGPPSDGIASSKPLANATFTVESERGIITSFTTDEEGHFRISLDAGHYTVSMKDKKDGIGRYGPFDVDVVAGKMTKIEWQCDTGLR
jgi:Prealbumin-like fold domain